MAKKDYLPRNRREMFKKHLLSWETMSISLWTTLFSFPLFALWSVSSVVESNILKNLSSGSSEAIRMLFQQQIFAVLISLPLFCLFAIGLGGAFYYMRKLVWREVASVRSDFFEGVKKGFRQSIFGGFLLWLAVCFALFSVWMTLIYASGTIMIIMFIIIALVSILIFSAGVFDLTQNAVYKNTFFNRLRNDFTFAVLCYPKNLLFVTISLIPFATFAFLPYTIAVITIATIYFVYGFGVAALLLTLYSHSVFDKYVNRNDYPQLVNKGLEVEKNDENHD